MNSTEYEKFVCDIQQFLLDAQGLETVKAQHNIVLKGVSSQGHQIDVYWEYRLAGITHRVALECKRHSTKVDLGIIRDFWGVLDDMPGLRGVVVSPVGFTSGAEKYAQSKGIGLKVIRQAQDADYDGRLKTIRINIHQRLPVILNLEIILDEAWYTVNANTEREALLQEMQGMQETSVKDVVIEEHDTGERIFLAQLLKYLPVLDLEDISGSHEWEKVFNQGFLLQPKKPDLKLSKIKVYYQINELTGDIFIDAGDVAKTLIKDAIQGTLLFVDEQGSISGDIEAEGY
jgi:Restriction endonuclease